jgi:hypothetical protein
MPKHSVHDQEYFFELFQSRLHNFFIHNCQIHNILMYVCVIHLITQS